MHGYEDKRSVKVWHMCTFVYFAENEWKSEKHIRDFYDGKGQNNLTHI